MKRILQFLVLTIICLVSLFFASDSNPSLAQANRYPDYRVLVSSLKGDEASLRELLRNGADPNSPPGPNDKGMTALMFAAWKGNDKIVQILVDAGANLNVVSNTGATPLMYAVSSGNEKAVNILLSKGARTDIKTRRGTTALRLSLKTKNYNIISKISKSSPPEIVNALNKKGDTNLLTAAKLKDKRVSLKIMTALLEGNPFLEAKDRFGETALMYAAKNGNTWAAIRLLKKGANPNTRDNVGVTA